MILSLSEIMANNYFLTNDIKKNTIYNGFLIFEKNNQDVYKLINLFVEKVINRQIYKIDAHEFGPILFKQFIDFDERYKSFNKICLKKDIICPYVVSFNNNILLFTGYRAYNYRVDPQYYYNLYVNNQVYFQNSFNKNRYKYYLWNYDIIDGKCINDKCIEIKNNTLHVNEYITCKLKIIDEVLNKEKFIEIRDDIKIFRNVF